ncbi:MAG: DNA primase [Clostridium sp.]|jgi:DNA primase|nr:DNA primase [Clostridium sp.]
MLYPEELIEEIRSKNDIVDVVAGYVRLQKKGDRHWGLCPFHNEKSPSFSVSESRQIYHCFGCGVGGDVFAFLMKYENQTFLEAVQTLAQRAGVPLPEQEASREQRQRETLRARLLAVNKEAAKFFYYALRASQGAAGFRYLAQRGLTEETMKKFGLGFADVSGAGLVRYLKEKGFEDKLLTEAGLARFSERHGLRSQFWNRVMFPIQDSNHRVIGFGGRVMGEGEPKYLNSPETPVFDKRRNLYGLNFARTARSGNIILCEGYLDVITLHQSGFPQAAASLGTAFTQEQALLLRRYTETVLLAYDSDPAGVKAALRGLDVLKEADIAARVVDMRPYKDPDEFLKNKGKTAFQERIDRAENGFFYEVRMMEKDYDLSDPQGRTRFTKEIARKLCGFAEGVERENYLQAMADKYYIGFSDLRKLVAGVAAQTGRTEPAQRILSGIRKKAGPEENEKKVERLFLGWLVGEPEIYPKIKDYISPRDFTQGSIQEVARQLFAEFAAGNPRPSPARLIGRFPEERERGEAAAIFSADLPQLAGKREKERALHDLLLKIRQNSYRRSMFRDPEDEMDFEKVKKGKKELQDLADTHISLD